MALIADPSTDLDELMKIVPGPDFPTGGIIIGRSGIRSAFETGRGSVIFRARAEIEEIRKRPAGDHRHRNALPGEQGDPAGAHRRAGPRQDGRGHQPRCATRATVPACGWSIELKRDATAEVVLNQLFRFTATADQLRRQHGGAGRRPAASDGVQGRAACAGWRFREEVILRRSRFELNKARERAHLLIGLGIAVANIDEIIRADPRQRPMRGDGADGADGARLAGGRHRRAAGADRRRWQPWWPRTAPSG